MSDALFWAVVGVAALLLSLLVAGTRCPVCGWRDGHDDDCSEGR